MKWKVRLEGGPEVDDLTDRFDDNPKIFEYNGDIFLWQSDFENVDDWREVLEQSDNTVEIIKSFANLDSVLVGDLAATTVYRVHEDGTHDIYHISDPAVVKAKAGASEVRDPETDEVLRTPVDRIEQRTKLALNDERVSELAKLREKGDSWGNLYKIYEFCEDNLPDGEEPISKG